MYTELVVFLQSGGPFMYPILIVFAFGLAIAIERYLYLTSIKRNNRKLLNKILPLLSRGQYKEVLNMTSNSKVAICKMLALGIDRLQSSAERDEVEMAMEEVMMETIPRIEKRTHYIQCLPI